MDFNLYKLLTSGIDIRLNAPKRIYSEKRKQFILEGLYDTGPKLYASLIKKFETPHNVFNAIYETELTFIKTGKPKGIEGPLNEIKGIGFKWIVKNKSLLKLGV